MGGILQGFLAEPRGGLQGVAGIMDRLRTMGHQERSREQEQKRKLADMLGLREEDHAREDAEKAWQHQTQIERINLEKEKEKRYVAQVKASDAKAKAAAGESKRRYEEQKAESDRRWETVQDQREEDKFARKRREVTEEWDKADKEYEGAKKNRALWEPLAKVLFPNMSESERAAKLNALAHTRAPSVTEQRLPFLQKEEQAEKKKKRAAAESFVRESFPAPEMPPVKFPEPPKEITKDDTGKILARNAKAEQGMYDEALARWKQERYANIHGNDPMSESMTGPPPPEKPTLRQYTDDEIGALTAKTNREAVAKWEADMKTEQAKERKRAQALGAHEAKIQEKVAILQSVPGAFGMAMAGMGPKKDTPESKGRAAARQQQTKEDFLLFEKLRSLVSSGKATPEQQAAFAEAAKEMEAKYGSAGG